MRVLHPALCGSPTSFRCENAIISHLAWQHSSFLLTEIAESRKLYPRTSVTGPVAAQPSGSEPSVHCLGVIVAHCFSRHRGRRLDIFFRKLYRLAATRLKDLTTKLNLSDAVHEKISTCLRSALENESDALLVDRQLDQLIMCSVHAGTVVQSADLVLT